MQHACSPSRARTSTTTAKTVRPGRKVGHVTVTAPDDDGLDDRMAQLRAAAPALFD